MARFFDTSLLPPSQGSFVLVADTHYLETDATAAGEFPSRHLQASRAKAALEQIAALEPDFIVHMGDLVQEFPTTPAFKSSLGAALQQFADAGLDGCVYHVAGNHDVGDKPDPTMPTDPADRASLEYYQSRLGRSWYSFDRLGLHGIVLNSQIMNTGLPQAAEQFAWLEQDLADHAADRTLLFLHLPPYLHDPGEPGLGHYDNLDQPARARLLELVEQYSIERVFAAHVHFAFIDQLAGTRLATVPSTSFTRPGFGHLFAAPPAPERGRDDVAKLGFLWCRVCDGRIDVHFVPTAGAADPDAGPPRLLTPTPAATNQSRLALSLTHPLSWSAQVPLAWPSARRQAVHNDYPLLRGLEIGCKAVRAPSADWADPLLKKRLSILAADGVHLRATALWDGAPTTADADTFELQLPGAVCPPSAALAFLAERAPRPFGLAPLLPGQSIPGKQHPRTRLGYYPEEIAELDNVLDQAQLDLDFALCRLDGADPWRRVQDFADLPACKRIGRLDFAVQLEAGPSGPGAAAAALFAAAQIPDAFVFFEPLIELDRTMDTGPGLLDGLCNPTPFFEVLRCLNGVLGMDPAPAAAADPLHLRGQRQHLWLLDEPGGLPDALCQDAPDTGIQVFDLAAGRVSGLDRADLAGFKAAGPTLITWPATA